MEKCLRGFRNSCGKKTKAKGHWGDLRGNYRMMFRRRGRESFSRKQTPTKEKKPQEAKKKGMGGREKWRGSPKENKKNKKPYFYENEEDSRTSLYGE